MRIKPSFSNATRRILWRYAPGAIEPDSTSSEPPISATAPIRDARTDEPVFIDLPAVPGWQSSSYDLKHGLDVVELRTSLTADILDRLFNEPLKRP